MSLLHRLGNFTSFFEDVTFTLQSFIGPIDCFLWFLFCWIYCLCQIVFLKSVVNCLLFLRIHVGLCYLQEFFPFHCGKGIGSSVGLSVPGLKSVKANMWSSFTSSLCLIIYSLYTSPRRVLVLRRTRRKYQCDFMLPKKLNFHCDVLWRTLFFIWES